MAFVSFAKPTGILSGYTAQSLILPELNCENASEAISALAHRLEDEGRLLDRTGFIQAAIAREQLSPTSCAPGWALPHARLPNLPQLSFALGRCRRPMLWTRDPAIQVHFVWLFAVPQLETKAYLNLIASIAKLSQNPSTVEALNRATDGLGMYEILQRVPLRGYAPPLASSAA